VTSGVAIFYVLAAALVLSAVGLLVARNVVHAALLTVLHFLLTAVLYVLLNAAFLGAVQLAVYAGAIMVLFLFVVMLMGNREATLKENLAGQRVLGICFVAALISALVFVAYQGVPAAPDGVDAAVGTAVGAAPTGLPQGFGSAGAVADVLFREYQLPLEIVSVLLLVAVVGVVVIARGRGEESPPECFDQPSGPESAESVEWVESVESPDDRQAEDAS
jgi:NADH-quinone oxidoreductase subunit J